MTKITAICEMRDQDSQIEDVRIIDLTKESIDQYRKDMDKLMGSMGYRLYYYEKEIPNYDFEYAYRWMRDNEEIDDVMELVRKNNV